MNADNLLNTFNYSAIPFFGESLTGKTADKNTVVVLRLKTPFGEMLAGATTKGICLLEFTDTHRLETQIPRLQKRFSCSIASGTSPFFKILNHQLTEYFAEKRNNFDIPLDVKGTEFQLQVWDALRAIPYGETRSYQQQAEAIKKPKAIRAVANANRNNRISIIIPCHRVIGKNGTMTGYGGGIWRKEFLLKLEKSS